MAYVEVARSKAKLLAPGQTPDSGGMMMLTKRAVHPQAASASDPADLAGPKMKVARRHQVHFWLALNDYQFLQSLARQEEEPMSRIIRRLIRTLRQQADGRLFIAAATKPALTSTADPSRKSA